MFKLFSITLISGLLSGCFSDPHLVYSDRQPTSKPVRNVTNIDAALVCMDNLLVNAKLPPIYITSLGIPNRAGDKVNVNSGIEMLKQAISQMSKTSKVFRFVTLSNIAPTAFVSNTDQKLNDHTLLDPVAINRWIVGLSPNDVGNAAVTFDKPEWIIEGSISQVDDNVTSETRGGSVNVAGGDFGISADKISSVISLDLSLTEYKTQQLRNGSAISNSIAILRSKASVDFGARLKSNVGAYIDVSNENNESGGQGVRTLIQLTAMQLLGDLANVPYQSCLHNDSMPSYETLAREMTTPPVQKLQLSINTSRGLSSPVYHVKEALDFNVSVNQAADVHCFINDANRKIHPIFPNLSQPNSRLAANQNVQLSNEFTYNFDKKGREQLFCLAAPDTLQSPWGFDKDVIHADALPVGDITDVESGYRQKTSGEVSFEKLTIYVE